MFVCCVCACLCVCLCLCLRDFVCLSPQTLITFPHVKLIVSDASDVPAPTGAARPVVALPSHSNLTHKVLMQLELQLCDCLSETLQACDTRVLGMLREGAPQPPLLSPVDAIHMTPTHLQKLRENKRVQAARMRKVSE